MSRRASSLEASIWVRVRFEIDGSARVIEEKPRLVKCVCVCVVAFKMSSLKVLANQGQVEVESSVCKRMRVARPEAVYDTVINGPIAKLFG
jgi:hypothetical protein